MKIFNWVNRRLLHNVHSSSSSALYHPQATDDDVMDETETRALLQDVGLISGFLTIGTLGLDPLKPFNKQIDFIITSGDQEQRYDDPSEEDEILEVDNPEEELNPLVLTVSSNAEKKMDNKRLVASDKGKAPLENDFDNCSTTSVASYEENGQMKKKGPGRTTLADLFLAETDSEPSDQAMMMKIMAQQENLDQLLLVDTIKKAPLPKHSNNNSNNNGYLGLSLAKKLIPRVKDHDSRPIKRLRQLMKKMLKRKIHPELDGKMDKTAEGTSILGRASADHAAPAAERLSLLQTPV